MCVYVLFFFGGGGGAKRARTRLSLVLIVKDLILLGFKAKKRSHNSSR